MMRAQDLLQYITDHNGSIDVIYPRSGAGKAKRTIVPIELEGDRMRAVCHEARAVKVFQLSEIEPVQNIDCT